MIVITGRKGYIGTNLKAFFDKKGIEAKCVDVRGEISDDIFAGVDTLIHAAGIVHNKKADKKLYQRVNVTLTKRLAELAKKQGVRHFVFFSTMAVYGMDEGEINENTAPAPASEYGKSKFEAERILLEMQSEEFKVTIIRPPIVYGKNCPGNYALLSKLVKLSPVFPLVDNKHSMIYIENLCACVCRIVDGKITGVIHPQNSEYVNVSDMCALIAEYNGKRLYLMRPLGKMASHIKIKAAKKAFGSLYYAKDIAFSEDVCTFEESVRLTET
ncbi:MAG: NAD-dependent epimerase/dehydratase family protein [Firmicutes bacterium]|nr:NAD-dependent epimerase/dehydratase family protein [Bacillota bacterium]